MPMPERYHPECPPNAHKVIRPPENELLASLVVAVPDSEETNGMEEVCSLLALMDTHPLISCSRHMRGLITEHASPAGIEPGFLQLADGGRAFISYPDSSRSETRPYYDWSADYRAFSGFLDRLGEKCLIGLNLPSMYILRSISTVYPWDRLLAQHFLNQYLTACEALTAADRLLLADVRYGRFDALAVKDKSATAYTFLRLERKLFLSYPTD